VWNSRWGFRHRRVQQGYSPKANRGKCAFLVSRHWTLRLAHQHAINPGTGEEPAPNEKKSRRRTAKRVLRLSDLEWPLTEMFRRPGAQLSPLRCPFAGAPHARAVANSYFAGTLGRVVLLPCSPPAQPEPVATQNPRGNLGHFSPPGRKIAPIIINPLDSTRCRTSEQKVLIRGPVRRTLELVAKKTRGRQPLREAAQYGRERRGSSK